MRGFLRFAGSLNAAIWCGAAIFVVVGVPALFSPPLVEQLHRPEAGLAAQAVLRRYFVLQYWCGGIALAHLVAERFLLGRRTKGLNPGLLIALISLVLMGGLWLQPGMRALHYAKYWGPTEQREQAAKAFGTLHAASESANLLVIGALVIYFWQVTRVSAPNGSSRFVGLGKIRG